MQRVYRFIGTLLGALLAVSPQFSVQPASIPQNPAEDRFLLPATCVDEGEELPSKLVFCPIGDYERGRPTILVWGDSHAYMMLPAVKRAAVGLNANILTVVLGSCPPMLTHRNPTRRPADRSICETAGDDVFDAIKAADEAGYPIKILLGLNWSRYLRTLEIIDSGQPDEPDFVFSTARSFREHTGRLFRALGRDGADVDVIAPIGQLPEQVKPCPAGEAPYACQLPRRAVIEKEAQRNSYARRLVDKLDDDARLIDVNSAFCDSRVCRGRVRHQGRRLYTYYDEFHISQSMARERMSGKFVGTVVDAVFAD